MTEQELATFYNEGRCPHCAHDEFLPGPHGGMMQNLRCCACALEININPSGFPRVGEILSFSPHSEITTHEP